MSLRWLWLVVFLPGVLLAGSEAALSWKFLGLTLLSALSAALLLGRLGAPAGRMLPVWLVLLVFLTAYYGKLYWLMAFPQLSRYLHPRVAIAAQTFDTVLEAYAVMTAAFASFCVTAAVLLRRGPACEPTPAGPAAGGLTYRRIGVRLLFVIVALSASTAALMYRFGLAVMGAESVYLPFRLAGLIFYTRMVAIPCLGVLVVWCGLRTGRSAPVLVSVLVLCAHGLTEAVLRGSKGALALMLVMVWFLLLVTAGKAARRYAVGFAAAILFTALLEPVISAYRFARLVDPASIRYPLAHALSDVNQVPYGETLVGGLRSLLIRAPGADMLLAAAGAGLEPLGTQAWEVLRGPRGVSGFFTVSVLGYPSGALIALAPSLVGWFYLLGGQALAAAGTALFTAAVLGSWAALARARLETLPLARALHLFVVLVAATDGVLDALGWMVAVACGSIWLCETWLRSGGRRRATPAAGHFTRRPITSY